MDGETALALIDLGADENYISGLYVRRRKIDTRSKDDQYYVAVTNGLGSIVVDKETVPLSLAFQRHHEIITFNVIDEATHNIVLGTTWLEQHKPVINWRSRVLKFDRCDCVNHTKPTDRQRTIVDETRN